MHESNGSITMNAEGIFIPKEVFGQNDRIVEALREAGALAATRRPVPINVRKVQAVDRTLELRWLQEHRAEYAGQWVGLQGDRLLSHGAEAPVVFAAAEASGAADPFFAHLPPADALPFGGW